MMGFGTDAVALATIAGAAAVGALGTGALLGAFDNAPPSCFSAVPEVSVASDGHRIEIRSGPLTRTVLVRSAPSLSSDLEHLRLRQRHRRPHRHAPRHLEMGFDGCVSLQPHVDMGEIEGREIEAQVKAKIQAVEAEMAGIEARIEAAVARLEPEMKSFRVRVRVQQPE